MNKKQILKRMLKKLISLNLSSFLYSWSFSTIIFRMLSHQLLMFKYSNSEVIKNKLKRKMRTAYHIIMKLNHNGMHTTLSVPKE